MVLSVLWKTRSVAFNPPPTLAEGCYLWAPHSAGGRFKFRDKPTHPPTNAISIQTLIHRWCRNSLLQAKKKKKTQPKFWAWTAGQHSFIELFPSHLLHEAYMFGYMLWSVTRQKPLSLRRENKLPWPPDQCAFVPSSCNLQELICGMFRLSQLSQCVLDASQNETPSQPQELTVRWCVEFVEIQGCKPDAGNDWMGIWWLQE